MPEFSFFMMGVLGSFLAGAMTGVGALPVFCLRSVSHKVQDALLGFGAGVMLALTSFSLIIPGYSAARPVPDPNCGSSLPPDHASSRFPFPSPPGLPGECGIALYNPISRSNWLSTTPVPSATVSMMQTDFSMSLKPSSRNTTTKVAAQGK